MLLEEAEDAVTGAAGKKNMPIFAHVSVMIK
jgi:hypothetical protein